MSSGVHFASFPGAIVGDIKWSSDVVGSDRGRELIAQGMRELWDSSAQETENAVPMSSRGSWFYYRRKEKKLNLWRQWLFLRKFPSCEMLEILGVLGHVTLDTCAAPTLLPRHLQNLHIRLMETRHWAGLSIHPELLFPFSSHMLALLFTSLFVNSGMRTGFPHCKLRERFTKVHWSQHNTRVAELLPFE